MPSLYEFAGGDQALHRLEEAFYSSVLNDPLLRPLFGAGKPEHVEHLTTFTAESFGGPDRFTRELGFAPLVDVHRDLQITEAQRERFVRLYMEALDASDLPKMTRSARPSMSTSNSARGSQCRTPTPKRTTNSIRFARFLAGPGPVTTRECERELVHGVAPRALA